MPQIFTVPPQGSRQTRTYLPLICIAFLASSDTVHAGAQPKDITDQPHSAYQRYLGKLVSIRGRFSLYGKVGAFVETRRSVVYIKHILRPQAESFTWDPKTYGPLENRQVEVTGTLHFQPSPPFSGDAAVARPPDYFYLDLELPYPQALQMRAYGSSLNTAPSAAVTG